ncbi:MAG: hypothetical protein QM504_14975, partial [Pseudomonadota bacterium]
QIFKYLVGLQYVHLVAIALDNPHSWGYIDWLINRLARQNHFYAGGGGGGGIAPNKPDNSAT